MARVDRSLKVIAAEIVVEGPPKVNVAVEGVICEADRPNINGVSYTKESLDKAIAEYNSRSPDRRFVTVPNGSRTLGDVALFDVDILASPEDSKVYLARGKILSHQLERFGVSFDDVLRYRLKDSPTLPFAFSPTLAGGIVGDVATISEILSIEVCPVANVQPEDPSEADSSLVKGVRKGHFFVSDEAAEEGFMDLIRGSCTIEILRSARCPEMAMTRYDAICDRFDEVGSDQIPEYEFVFEKTDDEIGWKFSGVERDPGGAAVRFGSDKWFEWYGEKNVVATDTSSDR